MLSFELGLGERPTLSVHTGPEGLFFSHPAHPERVARQVNFGVPFAASKTSRSFVLAVSNSTTKKLSECIKLKILLLTSPRH